MKHSHTPVVLLPFQESPASRGCCPRGYIHQLESVGILQPSKPLCLDFRRVESVTGSVSATGKKKKIIPVDSLELRAVENHCSGPFRDLEKVSRSCVGMETLSSSTRVCPEHQGCDRLPTMRRAGTLQYSQGEIKGHRDEIQDNLGVCEKQIEERNQE